MSKVIVSIKPKPIAKDDPENLASHDKDHPLHGKSVIYNDEGKLVEYTSEMFLLEVRKNKDNPYVSLYSGFEEEWAHYKIIVMFFKFMQILTSVLLASDFISNLLPQQEGGLNLTVIQGACSFILMLSFLMMAAGDTIR